MNRGEYHEIAQRLHAERAELHATNLRAMHLVRQVEPDRLAPVVELAAWRRARCDVGDIPARSGHDSV